MSTLDRALDDITKGDLKGWDEDYLEQNVTIPTKKAGDRLYVSLATSDYWHEVSECGDPEWVFGTVYPDETNHALFAYRQGNQFTIQYGTLTADVPEALERWRDIPDDVDLTAFDIIVCSTSSGKDSMAMLYEVARRADALGILDRVVAIHSDLGPRMDWPGCDTLSAEQAAALGVRHIICSRIGEIAEGKHEKTQNAVPAYAKGEVIGDLLEDVERRHAQLQETARRWDGDPTPVRGTNADGSPKTRTDVALVKGSSPPWFSPTVRFCTSEAKRSPLRKVMTALMHEWRAARGWAPLTTLEGRVCRILDVQGLRAKESTGRAKRKQFAHRKTTATSEKWTWLPIQWWTEAEVWDAIVESGLRYHAAYDYAAEPGTSVAQRRSAGMPRLSCRYCCYAPKAALILAATFDDVGAIDDYIRIEQETGFTFKPDHSMTEVKEAAAVGGDIGDLDIKWNM